MLKRNLIALVLGLSIFGCGEGDPKKSVPLGSGNNLPKADGSIRTKMNVSYDKASGGEALYQGEQELNFRHAADPRMADRLFAADFLVNKKGNKGILVTLTNIWAHSADRSNVPQVDLRFFIRDLKLLSGRTYRCAQGDIGCSFNEGNAKFQMDLAGENLVCELKIETNASLDFRDNSGDGFNSILSFPSSLHDPSRKGVPFAMAVRCMDNEKVRVEGHFLHNTNAIPSFEPAK